MERISTSESAMKSVLRFSAAGARGEAVNCPPRDWHEFTQCAMEHNVLPLVACALLNSSDMSCPETLKEYILNAMRYMSASNLVRRQRVLGLISELQKAGFRIQVLKGYAIAGYYVYPECRDSVDVDLLIDRNQEKEIYLYLENMGFKVTPRSKTSHQGVCQHSKYGVVEIHAHLYDELVEDVWFRGMNENNYQEEMPVELVIDGYTTQTLGYTDQLIFLTLHMIKHFIGSGLTIRMMLDVALFCAYNSKKIDFTRFWSTVETLQYATLVRCIWSMFVKYGNFAQSDFPEIGEVDSTLMEQILQDLECGGYMGSKELKERQDASMEYNRRVLVKEKPYPLYLLYMMKWKLRSAWSHMFPGKAYLIKTFPFVEDAPALIPFMSVYQAIEYSLRKLCSGVLARQIRSERSSVTNVSQRRIELFEELGML